MPLPAAEHTRVLAETKATRNAYAWVRRRGGTVEPPQRPGGVYVVRVPGFARAQDVCLARAVATLRWTVAHWPGGTGPTGARLRAPDGD
jgi:hypothetical protein